MSQAISIPNTALIVPVNLSSMSKTILLPVVSTNQGRVLVFKDVYGNAANSTLTLSTIGADKIEVNNVNSVSFSNAYGAWWFTNDGASKWFLTDAYLNSLTLVPSTTPLPYLSNLVVDLRGSSYSAGGSTWTNSVDNSTWTMTNTTYDATNGGPLFNGSSTFAYRSSITNWSGSTFSILCFYYKSSTSTTSVILSANRTASNITNEAIFYENSYFDYSNTYGLNFSTSSSINTVGLVMNSLVKNGTSGAFYKNGSVNGTSTTGTNVTVGNADFCIGKDYRDNNNFLAGTIKRYLIYNIALTASDIANIYAIVSSS